MLLQSKQFYISILSISILLFGYLFATGTTIPSKYKLIWFLLNGLIFLLSLAQTVYLWYFTKQSHQELFTLIANDDLKGFKTYLSTRNIQIKSLHTVKYYANMTPIIYSMGKNAFEIFQFLVENGYNLNYCVQYSEAPIIYAAYSAKKKYMAELLKQAQFIDINAKSIKFNANALEIAVCRGREKIVEMLLDHGMRFSIEGYSKTICGSILVSWNCVAMAVKRVLVKHMIYQKKKYQFNIHDKCMSKTMRLDWFNTRAYFMDNFLLYS